jgi:hypothetical protein
MYLKSPVHVVPPQESGHDDFDFFRTLLHARRMRTFLSWRSSCGAAAATPPFTGRLSASPPCCFRAAAAGDPPLSNVLPRYRTHRRGGWPPLVIIDADQQRCRPSPLSLKATTFRRPRLRKRRTAKTRHRRGLIGDEIRCQKAAAAGVTTKRAVIGRRLRQCGSTAAVRTDLCLRQNLRQLWPPCRHYMGSSFSLLIYTVCLRYEVVKIIFFFL